MFIDGIILAIIYWILLFVAAAISIGAGAGLIVTLLFGIDLGRRVASCTSSTRGRRCGRRRGRRSSTSRP